MDLFKQAQSFLGGFANKALSGLSNFNPQKKKNPTSGLFSQAINSLGNYITQPTGPGIQYTSAQSATPTPPATPTPVRSLPQQPPAQYKSLGITATQPTQQAPIPQTLTTGARIPSVITPSANQYQPQLPSLAEAAQRAAEARTKSYGAIVSPAEQAITAYLQSRRPIGEVLQGELAKYGVPEQQQALSNFEKDILKQQGLLETIPKEDLERRRETGMLSESAARRIQTMEERPIREQLLKTSQAQEQAGIGYNRALQLAQQGAQTYQQETEAGLLPLQSRLDSAKAQFGMEAENIAQGLTGFTQDYENQLKQYQQAEDRGFQLSTEQRQEQRQLQQAEAEHVRTTELVGGLTRDVQSGKTLNDVMGLYIAQGLDPDTILSLYNSYSPYGTAKEQPTDLMSRYGVQAGRYPGIGQQGNQGNFSQFTNT